MTRKEAGEQSEIDVCEKIPCMNCGKQFRRMRQDQNLFDLRCENCQFRVQVKSHEGRPSNRILGSGWNTMKQWHNAGEVFPPVIEYAKWKNNGGQHIEIRFYPFIKPENIKTRIVKFNSPREDYEMYDYINLDQLPFMVLYQS